MKLNKMNHFAVPAIFALVILAGWAHRPTVQAAQAKNGLPNLEAIQCASAEVTKNQKAWRPRNASAHLLVTSPTRVTVRSYPGGPSAQAILAAGNRITLVGTVLKMVDPHKPGIPISAEGLTFKVLTPHNGSDANLSTSASWDIRFVGKQPTHPLTAGQWRNA